MTSGVFEALPQPQRISYFISLVRSLHALSSEERFTTRAALRLLPLDAAGLIAALSDLSAPFESTAGKKRQRPDDGVTEGDKVEMGIADLTVLLESRDWAAMPGSAALAAGLMSALSALLTKRQTVKEGVDYLEQELLGAILAVLEKIRVSHRVYNTSKERAY
jgi:U3 small nucleolar RNA-associated protein 10